jgi:hypothetical protein
MSIYDDFLRDAIDLHVHIDLELSTRAFRKRGPEWDWLPQAEALGIRGVLLKSHWWPTATSVPYILQLYQGPVQLWSSIVLNPVVGGTELWAVEAAADFGARMVFLPTWGSCNDLERGGAHEFVVRANSRFDPAQVAGTAFLDADGQLVARGRELLDYCHTHDLTLGTGHVSWQESLAFAREAQRMGFRRLIVTHPLSPVIGMPPEAAREAAALGAWLEVCWTNVLPGRLDPAAVVEWIRTVGVEHVVVSTDYFRTAQPTPPELFRLMIGTLHDVGLDASAVRQVVAINPARALGLEPPASTAR